jgi:hypothetical protein
MARWPPAARAAALRWRRLEWAGCRAEPSAWDAVPIAPSAAPLLVGCGAGVGRRVEVQLLQHAAEVYRPAFESHAKNVFFFC